MKEGISSPNPKGSRAFSTMARRMQAQTEVSTTESSAVTTEGLKFGLPAYPLARTDQMRHRYDPVVEQVTKLIMEDGKLAAAQRVC